MGGLTKKQQLRIGQLSKWLPSVTAAFLIMFFAHTRLFANPEPTLNQLITYLQSNQLSTGTDTVKGYSQIFYSIGSDSVFITNTSTNNSGPKASGQYISWVEQSGSGGNIILYDVLTKAKLYVTTAGTHQRPVMDGNHIVWQGWVTDRWQVFYFDGLNIKQISSGDSAGRQQIRGNQILYTQRNDQGSYTARVYNIDSDTTEILYEGEGNQAWPHFTDDGISTDFYDQASQ